MGRSFYLFLSMMLMAGTNAVATTVPSDVVTDADVTVSDTVDAVADNSSAPATAARASSIRRTASRATPSVRVSTGATGRVTASRGGDNNASRTTVARSTTNAKGGTTAATRNVATRNTPSQVHANIIARGAARGTASTATRTPAAQQLDTPSVRTRAAARGVGSRVSGAPSVAVRAAAVDAISVGTPVATSAPTPAATIESIDTLAQTTDFCKAQYIACMDSYCNTLDPERGRCSCSANLKNYEKTADALKAANLELQDVAQKIQYIGLTEKQIKTLFSETLAEITMRTDGTDNSQIKTDLDNIREMIVDVKSARASSTTSSVSMDLSGLMNFNMDSEGFDLTSLMGGSSSTSSISNQRGEQLYKTANQRCKATVLNACEAQGVDISVITNAYDLEIDKQCIAYERSLTTANDKMIATVRNAKTVLQKARLMVDQSKNALDLRSCITELDNCMQDDYVCGDDYENCLDPSGKYIVNGEIVIGSEPGAPNSKDFNHLYKTWVATSGSASVNAWYADTGTPPTYTGGTVAEYIQATLAKDANALNGAALDMSTFLQSKIGYSEGDKNYGMCMDVLNQCQDYTYDGSGAGLTFKFGNIVIKEYLQRTMIQIKSKQDEILAEHAEECIQDVTQCLSSNGYTSSDDSGAAVKLAVNACAPMITTCRSVNGGDVDDMTIYQWIETLMNSCGGDSIRGKDGNCVCPSYNTSTMLPETGETASGYKLSSDFKYDPDLNACKCIAGGNTYNTLTHSCESSGT